MRKKVVYILRSVFFHLRCFLSVLIQNSIAGSFICPRFFRIAVYNLFGNDIKTIRIESKCFIGGGKLVVGKNSYISYENFFDLTDTIKIGDNVHIAMRSTFITSSHRVGSEFNRAAEKISAPIIIEDGCWICGGVTILPGVTIKKGTIIAAGSVVVKDCEENSVYAGVPAIKIKSL